MYYELKRALALTDLNFRQFMRDRLAAFFTIIFPLMFLASFGATNLLQSDSKMHVAVVGDPNASDSSPFAGGLTAEGVFIADRGSSKQRAMQDLRDKRIVAILEVPNGWRVNKGNDRALTVIAPVQVLPMARAAIDATLRRLQPKFGNGDEVATSPVSTNSNFTFIFPGLITLALLQLGLLATSSPLLRARENRSLLHLSLTPISGTSIFLAQLSLRMAVAAVQLGIILFLGRSVFHVSLVNGWGSVLLVAFISTAMLVAIGYAIAGLAKTQEAGMAIVMAANFLMLFLGDIFFDFSGVPFLAPLMKLMPTTYSADAFRQAVLGGSALFPMGVDVVVMLSITFVAAVVAVKTFRYEMGTS